MGWLILILLHPVFIFFILGSCYWQQQVGLGSASTELGIGMTLQWVQPRRRLDGR